MDVIGMGKVKTEAEEMQQLAEATKRTAEEEQRLRRYREREAKKGELFEGAGGGAGARERERAAAADELIKSAGAGELAGGIVGAKERERNMPALTKEQAKEAAAAAAKRFREEAQARGMSPREFETETHIGRQRKREIYAEEGAKARRAQAGKDAENLLARAAQGEKDALEQLEGLRARNPDLFKKLGPGELGRLTPEKFESSADRARIEQEDTFRKEIDTHKRERAEKMAGTMLEGKGRQALLENPDKNIGQAVRDRLKASGYTEGRIKEFAPLVEQLMREAVKKEIGKRAMEQGVDAEIARKNLLTEAQAKEAKRKEAADEGVLHAKERLGDVRFANRQAIMEHNKPQFMGLTDYAKKLTIGDFETEKWQQEMLLMARSERDAMLNVEKAIREQQLLAIAAK